MGSSWKLTTRWMTTTSQTIAGSSWSSGAGAQAPAAGVVSAIANAANAVAPDATLATVVVATCSGAGVGHTIGHVCHTAHVVGTDCMPQVPQGGEARGSGRPMVVYDLNLFDIATEVCMPVASLQLVGP